MEIILLVVLLVLVVALFLLSYFKKKKFNTELSTMREDLKAGDKVMTDTGVVGEVVEGFTEDEYKYFVLKTGRGEHVGYFTVHANAIYYVFGKEEQTPAVKTVVVKPKKEETAPVEGVVENTQQAEVDKKQPNEKSKKSTKKENKTEEK